MEHLSEKESSKETELASHDAHSVGVDPFFIVIIITGLILGVFSLVYGFPFYGDDSTSHGVSYSHFAQQLWQGHFYPRWIAHMNGGLGSAFFFYYSPVPYYLTSVLHLAFPNDNFGWRQLGIGAVASLIASGFAIYVWFKPRVGRGPSLAAAIVYMAFPYHLNIDLYSRGAYAELWSFVWMPLVLLFTDRVITRRRFAVTGLSVSYALLVMTHLPTTLIFSPVLLAYAFLRTRKKERVKDLSTTVGSVLLGVGLSAIYLVPALAFERFSFLSEGNSGHYFYGNWFLFTGISPSSRPELFWFTIEVAILAFLAFAVIRFGTKRANNEVTFWAVVAGLSIWMMSSLSSLVWKLLPTLQKVQFPWRFNTVLSLATAVLLAYAWGSVKTFSRSVMVLNVLLVLLMSTWFYDAAHRGWNAYPIHYVDQAVVDERNAWLRQARDQNEYRPRWVVSIKEKDLNELLNRYGKTPDINGTALLSGPGSVTIKAWQDSAIVLDLHSAEPEILSVSQFYFPGWVALLDNSYSLDVRPSVPGGLVNLKVPAGSHEVLLKRVSTRPEVVGEVISALSLLVLLFIFARAWFAGRKSQIIQPGLVDLC